MLPILHQKVRDVKVAVYKWRQRMVHESLSGCVLLQCCIVNELMHVKQETQDSLKASRNCNIVTLHPIIASLPSSYQDSFQTWFRMCSCSLGTKVDGIDPTLVRSLSEGISAYLVSNFHAVRNDTRDFTIVVAVNVYMKTIIDKSPEIGPKFLLPEDSATVGDVLSNSKNVLEQRKSSGRLLNNFSLEAKEKVGIFGEFMESDRISMFNLHVALIGDLKMIKGCIVEWLLKKDLFRVNPEPDHTFEEVKPALKLKKYDEECSKNSEETCAICLEELCEGDSVALTPCSHTFHCTAILGWLSQKMTCPTCRTVCPVSI